MRILRWARMKPLLCVCIAVAALVLAAAASAYDFVQIANGFDQPVYVTTAPNDPSTLFVVERAGDIRIVRAGQIVGTFLDIRSQVWSDTAGEGGLLSVAFHPKYAQNHLFYVDYTALDHATHVAGYRSENGVAVPASARDLLVVAQKYPNHKGGDLQFDRRGRLYVGMGDGGETPGSVLNDPDNRAQDLSSRLGKLLSIDPLASSPWRIVGYGLRNPWRFSFDRATGDLWLGDVGAGSWEELDFRPYAKLGRRANFGWSRYEGPAVYNPKVRLRGNAPLIPPVLSYRHDFGSCTIIGGYVYRGTTVAGARGRYFFGDFCSGFVWSFKAGAQYKRGPIVRLQEGTIPDLVSFGQGADGALYAVSIDGGIYALR
jgi:glucose/arabinose dehydrogenase